MHGKWLWMFGIGGSVYLLLELLYRGYSHPSMFFAGGLSAALIYRVCCEGRLRHAGWSARCAVGSLLITSVEFCTGLFVNLLLRQGVWDYSALPFNLFGQICLPFSLLWFFLSLPVLSLGDLFFGEPAQFRRARVSRNLPNAAPPRSSGR